MKPPALLASTRPARYALLLVPVMLAGCYVVPIVPGHHRPVYERSDRPPPPHRHRDHRHWRGELGATPQLALAAETPVLGAGVPADTAPDLTTAALDQSAASSMLR